MGIKQKIKREFEVAFSLKSQPSWFRILKYAVLILIIYFFWGTKTLWIILGILFIFAISLHLWYRYKTKGWKKSYGLWKSS
ncbi:MAG: hypothetical protein AABX83_03310 [Nanoarchaeota archaeon]